eukprot:1083129-Pleurochrysis_carterae.AAC.1
MQKATLLACKANAFNVVCARADRNSAITSPDLSAASAIRAPAGRVAALRAARRACARRAAPCSRGQGAGRA